MQRNDPFQPPIARYMRSAGPRPNRRCHSHPAAIATTQKTSAKVRAVPRPFGWTRSSQSTTRLKTPSIAGQPAWYLEGQLEKFRSGWRGADPKDVYGQQMRAIALSLNEAELEEVVVTVAAFPRHPTVKTFAADVAEGKWVFEDQCMECHRYNGSGEKVFGSSPLTAFQDWYLAAQLEKFRLGVRGYHAKDEKGQMMKHLTSYLSEEDVKNVSAYIATLAERYPVK